MAGHVVGSGHGIPAAGHELLVGMVDPGVKLLQSGEPGALNELGAVRRPQLSNGGAPRLGDYDGKPFHSVSIMEFSGEFVAHEAQYLADPFDAPPSRAALADPMPDRSS